jgi:hypothetical protein
MTNKKTVQPSQQPPVIAIAHLRLVNFARRDHFPSYSLPLTRKDEGAMVCTNKTPIPTKVGGGRTPCTIKSSLEDEDTVRPLRCGTEVYKDIARLHCGVEHS